MKVHDFFHSIGGSHLILKVAGCDFLCFGKTRTYDIFGISTQSRYSQKPSPHKILDEIIEKICFEEKKLGKKLSIVDTDGFGPFFLCCLVA